MSARTLTLLRHAKSAYPDGVEDHDRPLSERGARDARVVAGLLGGAAWPDLVLCSTAVRTRETWELVDQVSGFPTTVRYEPSLYAASARTMLGLVRAVGPDVERLLVVGHNPGVQDLAVLLAGRDACGALRRMTEKYPTAALAVLGVDEAWGELAPGAAELLRFDVPRA